MRQKNLYRRKPSRNIFQFVPRVALLENRETPANFFVDPNLSATNQTFNAGQSNQMTVQFGVNGFDTINDALTATASSPGGDNIFLSTNTHKLAPSSSGYPNTLTAANPVTIIGSGTTASTIVPTGNTPNGQTPVLEAAGAGGVLNLSQLTFDGTGFTIGRAFRVTSGATSTVDNVAIRNVNFTSSSDGYGLTASNGSTLTVTNSTIQNYGRAGISISDSKVTVQNTTITGPNNPNLLTYGVQITGSPSTASLLLNASTISNNVGGKTDGSGNFLISAGVYVVTEGAGSGNTSPLAQIYGNNIANNLSGVLVDSNADSGINAGAVLVYANNFSGSTNQAINAQTASGGSVQAPNNFYGGGPAVLNAPNGVTVNVNTGGSFLGTPAPLTVAATPMAYQTATGIRLIPGISTFAVGAGGGTPRVNIYGSDGVTQVGTVTTGYPSSFTGGVRAAQADVNGDGVVDTIVAPGPGILATIRVISGTDNSTVLAELTPFPGFTLGAFVSAADLNGDGKAEVLITPDQGGGPRVTVFDGASLTPGATPVILANFFGIDDPAFRGGARPALGDVTGDGVPDLVISAGFTGGPRITIWDGVGIANAGAGNPTIPALANFFAFEQTLRNGAFVATADINGDGLADPVFGAGPSGGPRVRVADAAQILALKGPDLDDPANIGITIANFFAGDDTQRGGVRVLGRDLDGDGIDDVITGSGDNAVSDVRLYTGSALQAKPGNPDINSEINPFGTSLANGVFVG